MGKCGRKKVRAPDGDLICICA